MTTTTLTIKTPASCIGNVKGMDGYRGKYAVVTVKLRPVDRAEQDILVLDNDTTVVSQSGENYDENDAEYFLEGIRKGIDDVVVHYKKIGVGIAGIEVVIDKLVVHPVDSTAGAFRAAARNAMASCLVAAT